MHTVTLLVGEPDGDRVPVRIVPNDGISLEMKLTALRVAEDIVIGQLLNEAYKRGVEKSEQDKPDAPQEADANEG